MKTYGGSGCIVPRILNFAIRPVIDHQMFSIVRK